VCSLPAARCAVGHHARCSAGGHHP
jgi:hypothetical protein